MTSFTEQELKILREQYAEKATDSQFSLWIDECRRRDLRPNLDIVLQVRKVKEWDPDIGAKVEKSRPTFITTVAGLRRIAERSGKYAGWVPTVWIYLDKEGNPTIESSVQLPDKDGRTARIPWAVRVGVKRKDFDEPLFVTSRFWACAQTYGQDKTLVPIWKERNCEMLEKAGKAAALRDAFPEETSGLYLEEENFHDEDDVSSIALPQTAAPVNPPPAPPSVPPVNQIPAQATDAPRPTEKKPRAKKAKEPKEDKRTSFNPSEWEEKPVPEGNIHGVTDITDADLPEFDKVDEQPAPDRQLTLEEKKTLSEELKGVAEVLAKDTTPEHARMTLREYIIRTTGAKDTASVTKNQWDGVLDKLRGMVQAGNLKEGISGA